LDDLFNCGLPPYYHHFVLDQSVHRDAFPIRFLIGYTNDEIRGILGGNFRRVLAKIWS
jgi:hypothetical protein